MCFVWNKYENFRFETLMRVKRKKKRNKYILWKNFIEKLLSVHSIKEQHILLVYNANKECRTLNGMNRTKRDSEKWWSQEEEDEQKTCNGSKMKRKKWVNVIGIILLKIK